MARCFLSVHPQHLFDTKQSATTNRGFWRTSVLALEGVMRASNIILTPVAALGWSLRGRNSSTRDAWEPIVTGSKETFCPNDRPAVARGGWWSRLIDKPYFFLLRGSCWLHYSLMYVSSSLFLPNKRPRNRPFNIMICSLCCLMATLFDFERYPHPKLVI